MLSLTKPAQGQRYIIHRRLILLLEAIFFVVCLCSPVQGQVIINEFLADNESGLRDADGDRCDWIELLNVSSNTVDLIGWHLTDSATSPRKWTFPAVTLGPGQLLLVFASGKDRVTPGSELHTNFKLAREGEYLALVRSDNSVASEFSPQYPAQAADTSFGVGITATPLTNLVAAGGELHYLCPTNGALDGSWTLHGFDASAWTRGTSPLGYDTTGSFRSYEDLILDEEPVYYWNFNENSGPALNRVYPAIAQDMLTPQGNAGRVAHSVLPLGRAASLPGTDGSRFYAGRLSAGMDFRGPWAVEFWLRNETLTKDTYFLEVSTTAGTLNSPGLIQGYNGESLEIFGGSAGRTGPEGPSLSGSEWHHILFAYLGSNGGDGPISRHEIFVDGRRVSSRNGDFVSPLVFGGGGLATGGTLAGSGVNVLKGQMDELAVYDFRASTNVDQLSAKLASIATNHYRAAITTNFGPSFTSDLRPVMAGKATSVYVRQGFVLLGTNDLNSLRLSVQCDDGFIAWLNGVRVASANAPDEVLFSSSALTNRPPLVGVAWEVYDLSGYVGLLRPGTNVLAVQGMTCSMDVPEFQINTVLEAGVKKSELGFLQTPTPGEANSEGLTTAGPGVSKVTENPPRPVAGQDIIITAQVLPGSAPISLVRLLYRVMYSNESAMDMRDDGISPDIIPGDGIFTAVIPGAAFSGGQMLRWAVVATDLAGTTTRIPNPRLATASRQYFGTVAQVDSVTSGIPILEWFLAPGTETAARTREGTRACLFYNGEFYDNVWVHLRGRTAAGLDKCPYEFVFNDGEKFRFQTGQPRVDQFALNTTWRDKSYVRPVLGFEFLRDIGVPASACFPLHVRRNGLFHSVALFCEIPDGEYLRRHGLDSDGALYKADLNGFTVEAQGGYLPVESGFEKKRPDDADFSDIIRFVQGLATSGDVRTSFVFDNVNIPAVINYFAGCAIIQHADRLVTNFYPYRDTHGNGEWTMLPWDLDLSLGQVNNSVDEIQASQDYPVGASHPFYAIRGMPDYRNPALWNRLMDVVVGTPILREMFLRRLRTLMDEYLCAPGTPYEQRYFEPRLDYWRAILADDVRLDRAVWPSWGQQQTLSDALNLISKSFLPERRQHLFINHSISNPDYPYNAGIPEEQTEAPQLRFGAVVPASVSGNSEQQFFEVVNTSTNSVDLSNWRVAGTVGFTFKPGTVLVASGRVYVVKSVSAFRNRATTPKGNEGLFVQGGFSGDLSTDGGALELLNPLGNTIAVTNYSGDFDGDGLPDEWEARYGFNANNAGDANLDPDADGFTNLQEYFAGTDPTNRLSSLKFEVFGVPPTFQFNAVSNRSYAVEYRDSLATGSWTRLQDVLPAPTNRVFILTDPLEGTNLRFYRVRTPKAD
jgi:hypothetical protein